MHSRCLLLVALLAFALLALPAVSQDAGASAWKVLFDGQSTDAFRSFRGERFPEKGWGIDDGCLHIKKGGGGGDIVTKDEYQDFELRFLWKVAPGANSGVMYRVGEALDAPWRTGLEYQILDDERHADGKQATTSAAALYALYAAEPKVLLPVGEFNEARIVVYRNQVEHWLNGRRVVAFTLGGEELRAKIAASKFKDMREFGTLTKGRISFQDHGDDVWFKDIKIRTLDASKEVALFKGSTFEGWTTHLEGGAKLEEVFSFTPEGILVCAGKPTGYIRTTSDHLNFRLWLEWRFSPVTKQAGNSGVLFRQVGPDKVWPRSIEAQLQSGSAGDFWNIGDFVMSVEPARTKGRNTKRLATNENPIGEWNHYEIEVDGGDVELRVNGMVLNRAWGAEEIPGKICLQSEGAEIHFRGLRILPIAR